MPAQSSSFTNPLNTGTEQIVLYVNIIYYVDFYDNQYVTLK